MKETIKKCKSIVDNKNVLDEVLNQGISLFNDMNQNDVPSVCTGSRLSPFWLYKYNFEENGIRFEWCYEESQPEEELIDYSYFEDLKNIN